jgi:hypothetical protein
MGRVGLAALAVVIAGVAMAPLACRVDRGVAPPDHPQASDASTPEGAEAPAIVETPGDGAGVMPGKPGPAYFAVRDEGVVMLDGGKLTKVEGSSVTLVREITQGPDGRMYLLGYEGVMQLDGAEIELVAPTPRDGPSGVLDAFAVARDGTIWGVGYKGVSLWDGSGWTTEDRAVLGSDVALLRDVTIDGQGRVWVASVNGLHLRDGDQWVGIDLSKQFTRPPFFEDMGTGPDGVAFAMTLDALVELTAPDALEHVSVRKQAMLGELGFSPTGVAGFKDFEAVVRIGVDGKQTRWSTRQDFAASQIVDVTPDDAGRLWVATDTGVAILGPGDEVVEWKSGSVDELVGLVEVIGVAGAGPVLLSAGGPVKKGSLEGKLVKDGKALAHTTLEICPSPSPFFRESPCADAPTRFHTTTDAKGRFVVEDVPLGNYGLAVQVDAKWQVMRGAEHRVREEGRAHDIGAIDVRASKP